MSCKDLLLIIDDEPKLVRLLRMAFTATGFDVISASSGENAVKMVALEQPDLVILDIMLPDNMDGFQVCKKIREYSDVPVIMLTARVADTNRLEGFECGADDYITKPFNTRELVARVRAVLKRTKHGGRKNDETKIICGELVIDLASRRVCVRGQEVHLTPTEYNLLYELARHRNQVMLHEHLLTVVWGEQYRNDVDYLRAYIYNLRKKIEPDPAHPQWILRYPGVGYMLAVPEEQRT